MSSRKRKAVSTASASDEPSVKRPSKKAKKEIQKAATAPESLWVSTKLHDVTFVVRSVKKGTGWRLDHDYTYGGQSSVFGGKGEITVAEAERNVSVSTCFCMKPGDKYSIQVVNRTALQGDSDDDSESDDFGNPPLPPVMATLGQMAVFAAPKIKKGDISVGMTLAATGGASIKLVFVRWNSERPQIYLVSCDLQLPATVQFLATGAGKEEAAKEEKQEETKGKEEKEKKAAVGHKLYNSALASFDTKHAAALAAEFCSTCDGDCTWCLIQRDTKAAFGRAELPDVFHAKDLADMEQHIKKAHACENKGCDEIGCQLAMLAHRAVCKFDPKCT